jgi:hypothetical protein
MPSAVEKFWLIFTDHAETLLCFHKSRLPIFFVRPSCEEMRQSIPFEHVFTQGEKMAFAPNPRQPALLGRMGIPND